MSLKKSLVFIVILFYLMPIDALQKYSASRTAFILKMASQGKTPKKSIKRPTNNIKIIPLLMMVCLLSAESVTGKLDWSNNQHSEIIGQEPYQPATSSTTPLYFN